MNPELQKELAAWLAQMRGAVEQGANFALEQAPLVVQEKVFYGQATAVAMLAFIAVVLLLGFGSAFVLARKDEDAWPIPAGLAVFIAMFAAGMSWEAGVYMPLIAPRLYVAEWLASLMAK